VHKPTLERDVSELFAMSSAASLMLLQGTATASPVSQSTLSSLMSPPSESRSLWSMSLQMSSSGSLYHGMSARLSGVSCSGR